MDNKQLEQYQSIPKEKFAFVTGGDKLHDQKFDTKPVGYFKDAFNRFKKNKASLVAAIIIIILIVYAVVGPWLFDANYQKSYASDTGLVRYKQLLPRLKFLDGTGFWDGSKEKEVTENEFDIYRGVYIETGYNPIEKVISTRTTTDGDGNVSVMYKIRVNTYYANSSYYVTVNLDTYNAMQAWQEERNLQLILPRANTPVNNVTSQPLPDIWYDCDTKGNANKTESGQLVPSYYTSGNDFYTSTKRIASDPGLLALEKVKDITDEDAKNEALSKDPNWARRYRYAQVTGKSDSPNYVVRVSSYNYFIYKYGFEPSFAFGTDSNGYDIFSRLASGARFSFMLAILVSAVNLVIGAIYGAIEGYYGGVTDMIMERVSDVLNGVPFMVVTVLFQLHLASKVGVVGSLIYAFVLTGWIGMASNVRMQFYRFKNQEYVLAARTLGAGDWRIIWKHIFPNTLGTLITSCVLVIPGVIFSETSLTYLGIVNLDGPTMSSVGSMLSSGQSVMTSAPHVVLFPALFIALLEISFNLFGNGLRDAFNPSLRGTEE